MNHNNHRKALNTYYKNEETLYRWMFSIAKDKMVKPLNKIQVSDAIVMKHDRGNRGSDRGMIWMKLN